MPILHLCGLCLLRRVYEDQAKRTDDDSKQKQARLAHGRSGYLDGTGKSAHSAYPARIIFTIRGLISAAEADPESTLGILAAFLAYCLIVHTLTSMSGACWLTERPGLASSNTTISNPEIDYAFDWSAIALLLGLLPLLLAIGISGYIRTRSIGTLTGVMSVLAIALIFYFWVFW